MKESHMAYGKDEGQLNRVVPFGGSLNQRARHLMQSKENASQNRSRGGAPYWASTFKCPTNHSRILRLIPGQYEEQYSDDDQTVSTIIVEYYSFREHYHGALNRGAICSAGPLFKNKQLAEDCEGCTMYWEDWNVRKQKKAQGDKSRGPNRMSMRDQHVFTVWDYGLWLKIPRVDNQGNIKTNQQNQPYYDWVMAQTGDPRVNQFESKFGHLIPWPMGKTYLDTLLSYNDTVQKDCATCGAQASIQCVSKICGNPTCEYELLDPRTTTLSPEQLDSINMKPQTCPACGQTTFVNDMIECPHCLSKGWQPRRASIFDVDLEVKAVASGNGNQTLLQILNRSNPRDIQVQDPEIRKLIVPLDLPKKFASTPVQKQREIWGIAAPNPMNNIGGAMGQTVQQNTISQTQAPQGQVSYQPPQQPQMPAMTPPQMTMPGFQGQGGNFGGQQ